MRKSLNHSGQMENAAVKSLSGIIDLRLLHRAFSCHAGLFRKRKAEPSLEEISTGTPHVPELRSSDGVGYRHSTSWPQKSMCRIRNQLGDRREGKYPVPSRKLASSFCLSNRLRSRFTWLWETVEGCELWAGGRSEFAKAETRLCRNPTGA